MSKKYVCLECDSGPFTLTDEEICPVCTSEDILDLPDEVDDFDDQHHEGDFSSSYANPDDRED